ncbi:putative alpha/beta-hydrolase family hydrolase [Actinomadura coerulea]|uniref:Putative alpha/beta-hydrolase family hydrolase n=1 Tax=Actinomadura coerulea TaxID=46159 RepID=A0A7X0KXY4_9ACTN|nr:alpha/beta family hydrolase [Actinomadura coerulea]MBB6394830.1 putative alpha/beta-hydrolase family hydrolase [Actinomadura coerulea]GGQ31741.1 alpha/beta hydrolase [Actinomadura coerulea]
MKVVTAHGPAEVVLDEVNDPVFLLVLTHGSNGGVEAADLLAVRAEALRLGGAVARVTQPFRLAGRRAPGPAAKQDEAWLEVVAALRKRFGDVPLVQGGRSNGARVACRTAAAAGAAGVVALAFPLHPPGRPEKTRVEELRSAGVEVVVVNGDRDPFGVPGPADAARVEVLPGERHDLGRDPAAVGRAVEPWLKRWAARPVRTGRR